MKKKRLWNLQIYLILLVAVCLGTAASFWFFDFIAFYIAVPVALVISGLCIWQMVHMQPQIHGIFKKAMEQLDKLKGAQVHTTVILSPVDETVFRKLGVDVTSEPIYSTKQLYHKIK